MMNIFLAQARCKNTDETTYNTKSKQRRGSYQLFAFAIRLFSLWQIEHLECVVAFLNFSTCKSTKIGTSTTHKSIIQIIIFIHLVVIIRQPLVMIIPQERWFNCPKSEQSGQRSSRRNKYEAIMIIIVISVCCCI